MCYIFILLMMINIILSSTLEVEAHHPAGSDKLRFMAKFLTWAKKSNPLESSTYLYLLQGTRERNCLEIQ